MSTAAAPVKVNPNAPTEEKVLSVEHYTDRLFSFSISRPSSFRFRSGEFVMIGLPPLEGERRPIMRAYSIASPAWDEKLDFYSIKVMILTNLFIVVKEILIYLSRFPISLCGLELLIYFFNGRYLIRSGCNALP